MTFKDDWDFNRKRKWWLNRLMTAIHNLSSVLSPHTGCNLDIISTGQESWFIRSQPTCGFSETIKREGKTNVLNESRAHLIPSCARHEHNYAGCWAGDAVQPAALLSVRSSLHDPGCAGFVCLATTHQLRNFLNTVWHL